MLSSYRDFETDKEWEWLHNDSPYADALVFESFEEDPRKAEMVVTNGWKSKVSIAVGFAVGFAQIESRQRLLMLMSLGCGGYS